MARRSPLVCSKDIFVGDFRDRLFKIWLPENLQRDRSLIYRERCCSCLDPAPPCSCSCSSGDGVVEPFRNQKNVSLDRAQFPFDREHREREREREGKRRKRPVSVFSLALEAGEKFRSQEGPCKSSVRLPSR